jgi:hypothetical protein
MPLAVTLTFQSLPSVFMLFTIPCEQHSKHCEVLISLAANGTPLAEIYYVYHPHH